MKLQRIRRIDPSDLFISVTRFSFDSSSVINYAHKLVDEKAALVVAEKKLEWSKDFLKINETIA